MSADTPRDQAQQSTNTRTSQYRVDAERRLSWRRLRADDLPQLAKWLTEPAVARWWHLDPTPEGVERDFGPSLRGDEPGEDLIVLLDDQPIGLLQRALIADYPDDLAEFSDIVDVPPHAVELDYLIGDGAFRRRGFGHRLIQQAVEDTWTSYPDTQTVLVAVVAANTASWRTLEAAGLHRIAEGPMTPENPIDDALHYLYRVDRPSRTRTRFA